MKLSKDFELYEFVQSRTANELGISNFPNLTAQNALRNLCVNLLQPLRNAIKQPITINSGYRCEQLNRAVKGAVSSQHMKGEAADCAIKGDAAELLHALIDLELDFDQAILYKSQNFLHLSLKATGTNRKQIIESKSSKTNDIRQDNPLSDFRIDDYAAYVFMQIIKRCNTA